MAESQWDKKISEMKQKSEAKQQRESTPVAPEETKKQQVAADHESLIKNHEDKARKPKYVPDKEIIANSYDKKKAVPLDDNFKKTYVKDEQNNYKWAFKPELVAFKDTGKKLTTQSKSEKVPADMLKLLKSRGVDEVKVTGTKEFKQATWVAAQNMDMKVSGYNPSKEELRQIELKTNSIAPAKDLTKEITSKLKSNDRDVIAKKDPQIKALISHENAAIEYAKKNFHSASQAKFISNVMSTLVNKAAKGEKIPQVKVVDKAKEAVAER